MRSARRLVGLLLVALSSTPGAAAQDTVGAGTIRGTVRDGAGRPVPDVAVCVTATSQCSVTDASGAFVVPDVRPGTYQLQILAPGQAPLLSQDIPVRAGLDGRVDVTLPEATRVDTTVRVEAPAFSMPDEVRTSGFLIAPETILRSAGALDDVSRYVQSLPGTVIGSDDFRNDLIVRGGSPLENLYIVDNVEVPNINTFANFASAGGTVGMLDANLLDSVTFLTGGFPAPYGNRTSSVLQIGQREGNRTRVAGRATVGFAGAGGIVEGPLGAARRGSWIVSVRRSFLDLVTDDVGIGGVPVLYTVNGKALYDLSARDRVWVVHLAGADRIRLGLTETSDPDEDLSTLDIRYTGWRSATGVNWQRTIGSRAVSLFGVTVARASVAQRVTDLIRSGLPPEGLPVDEQIARGDVVFREDSTESETTVKYDLKISALAGSRVQAGGQAKIFRVRYDTASPFGTDSPYFQQPDLNPFALREALTTSQESAYVQVTRPLSSRLDVTAGLRADRYGYLDAARVAPRVSATFALTPRLSARASAGRYYQQPFLLFLAAFPENRALKPQRADHWVGGLAYTPTPATRVTVEAYRKTYGDYPVSSQVPALSLASIGDTFALREIFFPMTSAGRGRVTGLEVFAERRPTGGRFDGQVNVAVSRTRHAGLDGILRPGTFDYPVVANAVGTYRVSPAWDVSGRVVYLGGRPYTPIDEVASAAQRRGVYDLSRVNGARAPAYLRIDARVSRGFTAWERPMRIWAGIQNVTDRTNVAGYDWDRRNGRIRTREQLGLFPILGLDWRF